jgi:hypothetical protein
MKLVDKSMKKQFKLSYPCDNDVFRQICLIAKRVRPKVITREVQFGLQEGEI